MYKNEKTHKPIPTWNPFVGCHFNCVYCEKSFKRQLKRQKRNCMKCYNYEPHFHPERLKHIPKGELVFACANGDISYASYPEIAQIFSAIQEKSKQTFLIQTKDPRFLLPWRIPANIIIGTTIETNRPTKHISKAPSTEIRYSFLEKLKCRKAVTIEPIMQFDHDVLMEWIWNINPEKVWVGYANHMKNIKFEEPSLYDTQKLIREIGNFTDVRLKTIREPL